MLKLPRVFRSRVLALFLVSRALGLLGLEIELRYFHSCVQGLEAERRSELLCFCSMRVIRWEQDRKKGTVSNLVCSVVGVVGFRRREEQGVLLFSHYYKWLFNVYLLVINKISIHLFKKLPFEKFANLFLLIFSSYFAKQDDSTIFV